MGSAGKYNPNEQQQFFTVDVLAKVYWGSCVNPLMHCSNHTFQHVQQHLAI